MSKSTDSKVWSIRNRIVFSITGLLLLFLAVTVIVSRYQVGKAAARGAYLDKHLGRFEAALGYAEASLGATVTTIAKHGELARCLGAPAVATGPEPGDPPTTPAVRCDPTAQWSAIGDGLQATLAPELTLLTDARDMPVGKAPASLTPERLRRELFYQQVSQGLSLTSWVQLGGETYVASGARIIDARGQRVGTVIVGIRLGRLLRDFAVMSDKKEAKRQQMFVVENGATLGSSFPASAAEPEQLATAFATGRRQEAEGSERVDVIRIGTVDFDYAMSPRRVFVGNEQKSADVVMARVREAHEDKEDRLELPILVTGAISLALSVALGLLLARRIVKPLRGLIHYTEQMARGASDLTHRFPEDGNDELAQLARNLNAVLDQLQSLFAGVKDAALEVGNSAAEISVTAGQLHQRSREESTKVEEITTAVSEMNNMIQQLSVNAQEAADHARTGGEGVGEASAAILDIRKTVVDVSEHVKTLGERSARIGNIVETIGQIADQTSLLALNASIEAAHAGEHGKGFAVVANEVSNLAERVNKSARQIEEQLAQIRLLTEQAVHTMQQATSTVDAGVVKVDSTFRGLNSMIGLVQEIGEREKEQASVSDNIARNMEDIFLIVREGLNASEQTVREGDRLKKLGEALLASVEQFKTAAEDRRLSSPGPSRLALPSPERSGKS